MLREADSICHQRSLSQSGAFHRHQALAAGHTPDSIGRRLATGTWVDLYPSVYAFAGTPATWERDLMAAILWSGEAAAGMAAGRLLDLPNCDDAPLEIITTRGRPMPHSGVIVRFTKRLPREQIIAVRNIPTTCAERTLLSLAAQWPRRKVAIAMDDAFRRGLTDSDRIDEFLRLTARRGRNGVRAVRDLARQRRVAGAVPERGLESVIWQLILDEGLPIPQKQVPIIGGDGRYIRRVDFFYPPDLVIEGQSKKWHTGLFAEEYDTDWQNALQEEGYRVLLLTHKHVTADREATARLIRRMLPSRVLLA